MAATITNSMIMMIVAARKWTTANTAHTTSPITSSTPTVLTSATVTPLSLPSVGAVGILVVSGTIRT
jgi:hypothetical protein